MTDRAVADARAALGAAEADLGAVAVPDAAAPLDGPGVQGPARFTHRSIVARMPLRSKIALAVLVVVIVVVVAAPVLPLANPLTGSLTQRFLPFGSPGHLLGTDTQGRDLLSRLVYGTRTSLVAGVSPIVIATVIGVAWGTVAGFAPQRLSMVLMRALDVLFAFPGVLLSLLLAITLGVGLGTLIIALTLVWIAPVARIAETEVARVRELDFVLVARSSGAPFSSILLRQIVPVTLPAVIAYSTSLVGADIAIAGGLGFLGLGVQSPTPELGSMVQELQAAIYTNVSLALAPVIITIFLSVLFPVVGDGLRSAITGRGNDL